MKENVLTKVIDFAISTDRRRVTEYVKRMRIIYPHLDPEKLARAIVSRKSLQCGAIGALTGIGGLSTLPVAVPMDLIATWRIQAFMVAAVAEAYGYQLSPEELKTDIIILMGANSAKESLKRFGIEVGKELTRRAIQRHLTREVMKRIWRVVGMKIITKAGEKSLTSFTKLIPLVGAPIGFGFDYVAARAVGKVAIHYYS